MPHNHIAFFIARAQVTRCSVWTSLAALIAAGLALGACASHQPRTPPQSATRTVTPRSEPAHVTVLDAGHIQDQKNHIKAGLAKNSREALAAADVGYYMDVLQGRLKQNAGKDLRVERRGDHIALEFFNVDFDAGSARLTPTFGDALATVAAALKEYRNTLVTVTLRGDDPPAPADDPQLGAKRAQALAHSLVMSGVIARRIVIAASPQTPADAGNRGRLELELEPIVLALDGER